MIRVAYCINSFEVGGTELNAVRTAEAFDRDRIALSVLHMEEDGPLRHRYEALGCTLTHIPIGALYSPRAVRQAVRVAGLLRRWSCDVVHTHDLYTNIFVAPVARLATRCGVLASRRWWYDAPRPELTTLNRLAGRFAHRILANSASVARLLREEEGVPADKVVEIPNFLAEAAFQVAPAAETARVRADWGVPPDAVLVGVVARLAPVKGLDTLLRALAQLGDGYFVAFIGDGPSRADLEALARDLGVGTRVRFLGQMAQIGNLHRHFDVSVLCSHSEGFPNSVVEALAVGRPVVATAVGGVPDVIEDGVTGLLTAAGDADGLAAALRRLAMSPALRERLGAAGREAVRGRYHQSVVIPKLCDVYRQLAIKTA